MGHRYAAKTIARFYQTVDHAGKTYMPNIGQEQPSIRNVLVVSSNRVHSTHLCEANKCGIFKPFFCLSDKRFLNIIIKIFFEEDKS